MRINWKIVSGVLTTIIVLDTMINLENRIEFRAMKAQLEREIARKNYMASKLDEMDAPLTEFDKIALEAINEM